VKLGRSSRRVESALRELGVPASIVVLSSSTRTAEEAAASVGVELGAIVKTLVFRGAGSSGSSGRAVVALVSGDRRADESLVAAAVGEPEVGRADAEFVRAATGYAIGGVAPIGFPVPLPVAMDEGLLRFDEVWAAAGSPYAVFGIDPRELARILGVDPVPLT
jgi:prolyl-tRNA editing enzyme YbaK/EbsC (Cys-tRNA(Pro) deacylase)